MVQDRGFLLPTHRYGVLVTVTVHPDLVTRRHTGVELFGKGFDGMPRPEPRRGYFGPAEEFEHPGDTDLPCEQTARDVARGVLTTVGTEPSADRVDVDTERDEDLLGHIATASLDLSGDRPDFLQPDTAPALHALRRPLDRQRSGQHDAGLPGGEVAEEEGARFGEIPATPRVESGDRSLPDPAGHRHRYPDPQHPRTGLGDRGRGVARTERRQDDALRPGRHRRLDGGGVGTQIQRDDI